MTSSNSLFLRHFIVLSSIGMAIACGGNSGSNIPTPDLKKSTDPTSPTPVSASPSNTGGNGGTTVTLTIAISGVASVHSEPAGIDCPLGQCTATFAASTKVTLTATPGEGWTWQGFVVNGGGHDACTSSSPTSCTIVITSDATITSTSSQTDPRWDPSVGARDCNDAWGKSGEKLSSCDTMPDNYVVVHKSKRNVALCNNGALVKNYRSGLGAVPIGPKEQEGDNKTPEGVFYVPRLLPDSQFYKAFLISYPAAADATRGLAAGLITKSDQAQITSANSTCTEPPQSTNLGGDIEINGNGSATDWTDGAIAVDNQTMDDLWKVIGVHDTVVVLP